MLKLSKKLLHVNLQEYWKFWHHLSLLLDIWITQQKQLTLNVHRAYAFDILSTQLKSALEVVESKTERKLWTNTNMQVKQ
jgi:hypothetical protein